METKEIKGAEGKNFRVILLENTFSEGSINYSVVVSSQENGMEFSRTVFDTLRKAEKKFQKEIKI